MMAITRQERPCYHSYHYPSDTRALPEGATSHSFRHQRDAYASGAAARISSFVRNRIASHRISESTEVAFHLFDASFAVAFPGSDTLAQPMVDF